jgi:hypothetical protein
MNCPLKHAIEQKIEGRKEVKGRRGIRRKQLLDELKETRGYWKLKEEALNRTMWRTRFGRGCGPVLRQIAAEVPKLPRFTAPLVFQQFFTSLLGQNKYLTLPRIK